MKHESYEECRNLFDESGKRIKEIEQELIAINETLMEEYNVRDYSRNRLNQYRSTYREFQRVKDLAEKNPYVWLAFASVFAFAVAIPFGAMATAYSVGKMISVVTGLVACTVLGVIGRKTDLARRELKTYPSYMERTYTDEINLLNDTIQKSTQKRSDLRTREEQLISDKAHLTEGRKQLFQYIEKNYPNKVGFFYQTENDFTARSVATSKKLQK